MPACKAHRLGGEHQAHYARFQRFAGSDAVRQHQIALQLGQALGRDDGLRELAEAGVDAVGDCACVEYALHHGLRGEQARARLWRQFQVQTACMDAAQAGEIDLSR